MVAGVRRDGRGADLGSGSELDRGQRFALFSAVHERLARAAEPDGLLLVLDDIQWADEPSLLLLLAHLVRQLRGVRMLILATCRRAAPPGDRGGELIRMLPADANTERAALTGLPRSRWPRCWPRPGRLPRRSRLRRYTRKRAATRSWSASWPGCARSIPGGPRPARCPEPCSTSPPTGSRSSGQASRDVLRAAAVGGIGFSVGVVARMLGTAVLALLDPVDELAAGFLVAGDRPGDYRFSHALALARRLPVRRRGHLRRRLIAPPKRSTRM